MHLFGNQFNTSWPEILTDLLLKIPAFWDVVPYRRLNSYHLCKYHIFRVEQPKKVLWITTSCNLGGRANESTQEAIRWETIMTTQSSGWHSVTSQDSQNESSLLRRTQISQLVPQFTCTRRARRKTNSVCLEHKDHIIDLLLHHCHSK